MRAGGRCEESETDQPRHDRKRHKTERPFQTVELDAQNLGIAPRLREKVIRIIRLALRLEIFDEFVLPEFCNFTEVDQRSLATFQIWSAPEIEK